MSSTFKGGGHAPIFKAYIRNRAGPDVRASIGHNIPNIATILQDVGGQGQSQAFAINSAGDIVGFSYTVSGSDAVEWLPNGTPTVLPGAGGQGISYAYAYGINNAGYVAGATNSRGTGTSYHSQAVLWSPNGMTTVLPYVRGQVESWTSGINNAGDVVGGTNTGTGNNAVVWLPNGKTTVLPDVGGQGVSVAEGINNTGDVVGYSQIPLYPGKFWKPFEAIVWSPKGKATVLQDVGGQGDSQAHGINNAGYVVGFSKTLLGDDAIVWSPKGKGTVLQDVGGQGVSFADGINDAGDVVGWSWPGGSTGREADAVLWSPNGTATVLPDVGGQGGSYAVGINNLGDVVGYSYTSANSFEAVEWSPVGSGFAGAPVAVDPSTAVPEVSTWAMMLVGFAGLGLAGYRVSRRAASVAA